MAATFERHLIKQDNEGRSLLPVRAHYREECSRGLPHLCFDEVSRGRFSTVQQYRQPGRRRHRV
jgi:hypothetical protein